MTEAKWVACTDPGPMLEFLRGRASDRKLRLFAVACCRRVWHLLTDGRSRGAVEVAERYADGETTREELGVARDAGVAAHGELLSAVRGGARHLSLPAAYAAFRIARRKVVQAARDATAFCPSAVSTAYEASDPRYKAESSEQTVLLRDIFGPLPFRPVTVHPPVLAWNDRIVPRLAQVIYDQRRWGDMPLLGDALLDAGCDNEEMLTHAREQGAVHVRGCWLLDLLLDKE
jgi:hypothetical protein